MAKNIQNDLGIKDEFNDLEEYSKNINDYYSLKNKYDEKIKKSTNKIIAEMKKKKSLLQKIQQKIKNQKIECINCFKDGGTLFYTKDNILFAKCGNKINPCKLNIEIHLMVGNQLIDKIAEYKTEIDNIQLEINHFKNRKIHFKEDFSESTYENLKKKLDEFKQKYDQLVAKYNTNYLVNLEEKQELANLQIKLDELFLKANYIFNEFLKTKNISIINDLVSFQENEIKPIENKIDKIHCFKRIIQQNKDDEILLKYKSDDAEYEYLEKETFKVKHFSV